MSRTLRHRRWSRYLHRHLTSVVRATARQHPEQCMCGCQRARSHAILTILRDVAEDVPGSGERYLAGRGSLQRMNCSHSERNKEESIRKINREENNKARNMNYAIGLSWLEPISTGFGNLCGGASENEKNVRNNHQLFNLKNEVWNIDTFEILEACNVGNLKSWNPRTLEFWIIAT